MTGAVAVLDPFDWTEHTLRVLTAIGTVGAVIVAILLTVGSGSVKWLVARHTRPTPTLRFDPEIDLTEERIQLTQGAADHPALYVRIRVTNDERRRAAEGVEVLVAAVVPHQQSKSISYVGGGWNTATRRHLGPLAWTHADPPDLRIGPGVSRSVALGYVTDTNDLTFYLGLKSRPHSGVHLLDPGSYTIVLTLAGSNFAASTWSLNMNYEGTWFSGAPLLDDHLVVSAPIRDSPEAWNL